MTSKEPHFDWPKRTRRMSLREVSFWWREKIVSKPFLCVTPYARVNPQKAEAETGLPITSCVLEPRGKRLWAFKTAEERNTFMVYYPEASLD